MISTPQFHPALIADEHRHLLKGVFKVEHLGGICRITLAKWRVDLEPEVWILCRLFEKPHCRLKLGKGLSRLALLRCPCVTADPQVLVEIWRTFLELPHRLRKYRG